MAFAYQNEPSPHEGINQMVVELFKLSSQMKMYLTKCNLTVTWNIWNYHFAYGLLSTCMQEECFVHFTLFFHAHCAQMQRVNQNPVVLSTRSQELCISEVASTKNIHSWHLSFKSYSRETNSMLRGNFHLRCCLKAHQIPFFRKVSMVPLEADDEGSCNDVTEQQLGALKSVIIPSLTSFCS